MGAPIHAMMYAPTDKAFNSVMPGLGILFHRNFPDLMLKLDDSFALGDDRDILQWPWCHCTLHISVVLKLLSQPWLILTPQIKTNQNKQ